MDRIFLIGYMGAGKTTLGRALARLMGLSYIDTDQFIENRYHRTVSDLFATNGEEQFREMEHRVICELSGFEDVVISTGGGLPCFGDNMQVMNMAGVTVFLDVPVSELAARLEVSRTVRPILKGRKGQDLCDFIAMNLESRMEFYRKAMIHFDAEKMDTEMDIATLAVLLRDRINEIKE